MKPSQFHAVDFLSRDQFSKSQIKSFDCGDDSLNNWLRQFSGVSHKKGITTMLMVPRDENTPILGYSTVCASSVERNRLAPTHQKGLAGYPVPIVLIARFAIAKEMQGRGLGRRMIMHIYKTVLESVERGLGSRGIMVDAKDESAVNFYRKYDLEVLAGQTSYPRKMFIPIETLKTIF